jgi:diacylglycerol kinase family enzyme
VPRIALIVNPFSSGVTRARVDAVEETLRARAEVSTRLTERPRHAVDLAAEAAGKFDALVLFSGDGTYNEALNGAAGRIPFGFLPGGGASVLSRALGLPREPVAAAAAVAAALAEGRTRTIGLCRVNGRRFSFAAGIGLDAAVVRRVEGRGRTDDGRRAGNLAYATTAAAELGGSRLRLEPRLEVVGHGRAAFLLASNGWPYTYAGPLAIRLFPGGRPLAGALDFAAPQELTPARTPLLLAALALGRIGLAHGVLGGHGLERLEVRCDRPLPLQADGEDLGDAADVVFEAEPNTVTVLG